jgi:nucleoside-diphosphate-sugar epimerase
MSGNRRDEQEVGDPIHFASARYERVGGPVKRGRPARPNPVPAMRETNAAMRHLDDAAAATVLALEYEATGIYNVVDDDPAPVREWLPVLADVLGAKAPRHVPRWLARLFAGEALVMIGTESRGASNAKAKRKLGWELHQPPGATAPRPRTRQPP